jgi:hypothetical protein
MANVMQVPIGMLFGRELLGYIVYMYAGDDMTGAAQYLVTLAGDFYPHISSSTFEQIVTLSFCI